jgi:para-aminobenzoate synthetase/4-amino-4-deoxychorismate lyase
MQNSAQYFNFYFSHREAALALKGIERRLLRKKRYKVRLLLGKDGNFTTEYSLLADGSSHKERLVALSRERIDPAGIWLYHKSTNRALDESEYAYYRQKGYYEVVFLNTRNEFTEGSFSNIIIQSGARFYTPQLSCGLLPGIFRAYLLKNKQAQEKIIGWRELERAERIYLCNSVRGMVEVKLEPKEKGRSDVYPRGII